MILALMTRLCLSALLLCASGAAFAQQGTRLFGTGAVGNARQGFSVAISADGLTAAVGGCMDAAQAGAVWVFVRAGANWVQQGPKLVGTGATGSAQQGYRVAISSDGNTLLVGGPFDATNQGAAWVFTREAGQWSQQGPKLVGSGMSGIAEQGISVALSADGNTALVGGSLDAGYMGAAWVFVRSAGVWTQQGAKLVGAGFLNPCLQGSSVALSADGNTAAVGAPNDALSGSFATGTVFMFTRSGVTWAQQGPKLVDSSGWSEGREVALSGDGNTLLIGGGTRTINNESGSAVWTYRRAAGAWTRQGDPILVDPVDAISLAITSDARYLAVGRPWQDDGVGRASLWAAGAASWSALAPDILGAGTVGVSKFGTSVSISGDGKVLLVGASDDDSAAGATWVYSSPAGVSVAPGLVESGLRLAEPFPNPGSGVVEMRFRLPRSGMASISVVDITGRTVRTLLARSMSAGEHTARWDGTGSDGVPVASGIYHAILRDAGGLTSRRFVRLR